MRFKVGQLLGALLVLCVGRASPAAGQEVVLDTAGFWRMYHVMKGPVLEDAGSLRIIPHYDETVKLGWQESWLKFWHKEVLRAETAPPPAGWTSPDFDDSSWVG